MKVEMVGFILFFVYLGVQDKVVLNIFACVEQEMFFILVLRGFFQIRDGVMGVIVRFRCVKEEKDFYVFLLGNVI